MCPSPSGRLLGFLPFIVCITTLSGFPVKLLKAILATVSGKFISFNLFFEKASSSIVFKFLGKLTSVSLLSANACTGINVIPSGIVTLSKAFDKNAISPREERFDPSSNITVVASHSLKAEEPIFSTLCGIIIAFNLLI